MRKFLLLCLMFMVGSLPVLAQNQGMEEKSIDVMLNELFNPAAEFIFSVIFYPILTIKGVEVPFILLWLITGAIVFTFYLNFINIRGFGTALDIIKGKYTHEGDPGEVTHFQALTAALSGTVGLGNIAGVAVAIATGGPGATFWMMLFGLFGMSSKFVECALAVKFRDVHADGSVSGGPMYYLRKGLAGKGMGRLGGFLAGFFAIMAIGASFGGGNMFQVNQAAQQFIVITGGQDTFIGQNTWIFGLILAILVAVVIIGGIKSIAMVTERIVPFMTIFYVFAAIAVIVTNIGQVPDAFATIVNGAVSGEALGGGLIGTLITGMRRATFSNEAGVGSAAIAHSAVKTSEPITEGFVASLEPFVDTVIVCTMTALVIVISGVYKGENVNDGIALTSDAFATVIDWFPYMLSIAVILFAFSTMISWSYYGVKAWTYVFGNSNLAVTLYKVIFCLFIVLGASVSLGSVIDFSDGMLFAMSLPNILGCYILAPLVKKDMQSFLTRIKKGKIETYD
ncbi:alanine/glycine:cation symporter family protein [Catalinimonas niigatensis]|uniref:alanine/glycine:cation symporter family protein n=1 Tax=Catalinimonas niigatensis TaxID=1397264 RepID=UPI0026651959|nr:alanine/glycine:cation symporter family protein [Catalinimonas niigatensis]WPP52265.1 alanine/glycine:cation symporter family protein [Catalinimonas niigatensis]